MNVYWSATIRLAAAGLAAAFLIYATVYWAFSDGDSTWGQGAVAPGKRVQSVAAVAEGKLYVFVGFRNEQLEPSRKTYVYDPESNEWNLRESAPLALSHAAVAVDGSTVWMAGGFVGRGAQEPTSQVFRYETKTDTWLEGTPLPVPIGGGGLVRSNRTLHYLGGFIESQGVRAEGSHWTLDLDEPVEWKRAAPMQFARGHAGVVAHGQTIFVIGGTTRHGVPGSSTRRVSAYDSVRGLWKTVSDLPFPRSHFEAATFSHGGRIYVVGGRDDTSEQLSQMELRDITVYEPTRDIWTHSRGLPVPLRSPVARIINNRFYVTHGSTYWTEAPQQLLWHAPCDNSSGSPCATSGLQNRVAELQGFIRSLAKEHVGALPYQLQESLFLSDIAER